MNKKCIVTGAAGFIGFHLSKKLLKNGYTVLGIDNLNNYYSKQLKLDRLKILKHKNFKFIKADLKQKTKLKTIFKNFKPDYVYNLAAQAGVRYSILKPLNYINNNIIAFQNILDLSKDFKVKLLIYASSSSVYGKNSDDILKISSITDKPISPYAVTKKTNEMMASVYSGLHELPTIGFRFFTVYGPWGRPDMSLFKFTDNMFKNKKILLFNKGNHKRDFTYIDDVTVALLASIKKFSSTNKIKNFFKNNPPSLILNISGNKTTTLMEYVKLIEKRINKRAIIEFKNLQPGDVVKTTADISQTKKILGYNPKTSLSKGISAFIKWYRKYYK